MRVVYKELKDTLVLTQRIHGTIDDLPKVFDMLKQIAGDAATGTPFVVIHFPLTDEKGRTMDVCIPLTRTIESANFQILTLKGGIAATTMHKGPYSSIMNTYRELIPDVYKHGHPIQENGREAFHHLNPECPEDTVVEIQAMIIDWENRLEHHLERVLGKEKSNQIISGFQELTLETEQPKRAIIIKDAIQKLDRIASEQEKYEALSCCGHEFPLELVEDMHDLYQKTRDIDAVIQAMSTGHYFYPQIRREGNILYDKKSPARTEAYEKAQTREEKLRAACFCPLLNDMWDEMPDTFCYCAAGWPRRLFEGILGIPLKIEITRSLTKGDDYCEFAIHLPPDIQ